MAEPINKTDDKAKTIPQEPTTPEPSPEKDLPWNEVFVPEELTPKKVIPFLRFGAGFQAGAYYSQDHFEPSVGGHVDITLIEPKLSVAPQLGEFTLPIFFQPRIDADIGHYGQSMSAGMSVHLPVPEMLSFYGYPAAGANHVDGEWSPSFDLTIGAQLAITGEWPLLYLEYGGTFFDQLGENPDGTAKHEKHHGGSTGVRTVF